MIRKIIFIFFFTSSLLVTAQDHQDVMRLSQSINSGTARFVSMGGAFGALGADFTSLTYNPAGLGVYRASEFTVTTSLKNKEVNTLYLNNNTQDFRTRFLFDNIGFVTSFKTTKEEEKGLVFLNIGIGYNRLLDFFDETSAFGANTSSSIMNHFVSMANGSNWFNLSSNEDYNPYRSGSAPWDAIMAWNTFLIDTISGSINEYSRALNIGEGVYQDQSLSTIGGLGEFTFSFATNFSNKLFIGATIGVQDLYYKQTQYYWEEAFETNTPLPIGYQFENLDYKQTLTVEGSGINFKIGAIYKPIPMFRAGIAIHTPTFFSINETYRASIKSVFNDFNASASTPINFYDYRIQSPFKAIGSLAFTFGEIGLISFDYEYIDYSTARFIKGGDGYRFSQENSEINNLYSTTYNLKAGGEVWLKYFALRAGYAYYGSPFEDNVNMKSSAVNVLSAGFGLRIDNLFIDWAYQKYYYSDKYSLYINSPVVDRDVMQNKFLLTLGFKF
jgi:hypothetical protein